MGKVLVLSTLAVASLACAGMALATGNFMTSIVLTAAGGAATLGAGLA
jgi:hypothetical protein